MAKYINFEFATQDDCLEKMHPSDLRALVSERDYFRTLLDKHGVCTKCGEIYSHEIEEPFAHCGCGTSEWHNFTPYMELENKLHSSMQKHEVNRTLYAVEVSYGDGFTWSAGSVDLYCLDKERLEELRDEFEILNNDPDTSFSVVPIKVLDKISDEEIKKFKESWGLYEKICY